MGNEIDEIIRQEIQRNKALMSDINRLIEKLTKAGEDTTQLKAKAAQIKVRLEKFERAFSG